MKTHQRDKPASPKSYARIHARLIRQSHERSRKYGVDPFLDKASEATRLSPQQLKKRIEGSQPFYDLVTGQMSTLYKILEGSDFVMAVADREGYILYTIGHGPMMEQYETRNCVPGYRWTERDLGTCAIGIALHSLQPVQLAGSEMFSLNAQQVTNSAAPVFDDGDRLLGVIALSGPADQVHIHTHSGWSSRRPRPSALRSVN